MMFMSDKPEKTAPKVEAKLRKDFASATPLAYDVLHEGAYRPNSFGQLAGDVVNSVLADFLVGGTRPLHTIRIHAISPRSVEVKVNVIKAQAVCIGSVLFSTFVQLCGWFQRAKDHGGGFGLANSNATGARPSCRRTRLISPISVR